MFVRLRFVASYRTPPPITRSLNSLARVTWDAARAPTLPIADENYEEVVTTEAPIKSLVQSLLKYGLALVHHVPDTTEATRSVLERLGPAWPTFWGEEFHVVADLTQHAHPSYTSGDLGLHTDTNYYHEGAGLQAFHVLEHTGTGGINTFVDGFHVAKTLHSSHPAAYAALSTIPVPFKYRQNGTSYSNTDFVFRHHPTTAELLQVRGMKDTLRMQAFNFDQPFSTYNKETFFQCFFRDPVVVANLQMMTNAGTWTILGYPAENVDAERLTTEATSMTFFNRLYAHKVVRGKGIISKCMDEYRGNIVISDLLRKTLLDDESELYDMFTKDDRQELIFRIFRHVCLGGTLCQYEDNLTPYVHCVRAIYKEMVSVIKDPSTQAIRITNSVYRVKAKDRHGTVLYPAPDDCTSEDQSFAYISIDPARRMLTVLYNHY